MNTNTVKVSMMKVQLQYVSLIWSYILLVEAIPTVKDINKLKKELLKDYDKTTLPCTDYGSQFKITVEAYPLAVGDIEEVEEELATVLGFIMTWNDTSIQWDPAEHNNITNITIGLDDVWKPNFILINPHQNNLRRHVDVSATGIIYSNLGKTSWLSLFTLHTPCNIETTYFPFDVQKCDIYLRLSGYESEQILIDVFWADGHSYEKETGAWDIILQDIQGIDSDITVYFDFKRKPMFMMMSILLPIIILALLTPLVFLMPKSSGERIGYCVTMLLAVSVYMTMISDYLPKNSNPMPLVSIMIFVWYLLNAAIVFIVIMNIKVSHTKNTRRIPGCVCRFVTLTRAITRTKSLSSRGSGEENEKCLNTADDEKCDEGDSEGHSVRITWIEVSVAIDKWCFVCFYFLKITIPAIFIAVISK